MTDIPTARGSYAKVGSTVVVKGDEPHRGVVVQVDGGGLLVAHGSAGSWWGDDQVTLPLDVDTNRAHVAWGVAERLGLPMASSAQWTALFNGEGWAVQIAENPASHDPTWWPLPPFHTWLHPCATVAAGEHHEVTPALAHIDPNDPTTLPDGSRLVDAQALAVVARHVEVTRG